MTMVRYERDGAIAVLTLNRPDKMNAYHIPMHEALLAAIERADSDNSVRVIIVTGAGKAFCAGADISQGFGGGGLADGAPMLDGIERDYGGMLNLRIYACDTPVIAAINGVAVGIGATMTLPMDIRIAADTARFAFPFTRRGIAYDGAASWFLPRLVGLSRAQEWGLTGRLILADEAFTSGLVHQLAPKDQVLERAMELARDLAVNISPEAAAQTKQLMRESLMGGSEYDSGPMRAHMAESRRLMTLFRSADCHEGVRSFLEKRPPNFKDREL